MTFNVDDKRRAVKRDGDEPHSVKVATDSLFNVIACPACGGTIYVGPDTTDDFDCGWCDETITPL